MKSDANAPKARSRARQVRTYAKRIAKGTLIAAALAATRLAQGEAEPQIRLFDPAIVDRLNEPLSRHHE
jgi:hypothetical protein